MYPLHRFTGVACSILAVALTTVVLLSPAHATTVEEMSLEEMSMASSSIVYGKVIGSSSHWNEDRSLIVTDIQVEVLETLKGAPIKVITVTQPGGEVGKLRVDVPGAAAYRDGEETVLFLGRGRGDTYAVAGISRGRFDVKVDKETGARTVPGIPAMASRTGQASPSGSGVDRIQVAAPPDRSLDGFLRDIRQLVSESEENN